MCVYELYVMYELFRQQRWCNKACLLYGCMRGLVASPRDLEIDSTGTGWCPTVLQSCWNACEDVTEALVGPNHAFKAISTSAGLATSLLVQPYSRHALSRHLCMSIQLIQHIHRTAVQHIHRTSPYNTPQRATRPRPPERAVSHGTGPPRARGRQFDGPTRPTRPLLLPGACH